MPASGKSSDFRKWGERQGKKVLSLLTERKTLTSKISDLEKQVGELQRNGEGRADNAALQRVAALEKSLKEKEDALMMVRYEKSEDYRNNFEKPYQDAWQEAYEAVGELVVSTKNVETDEVTQRQATRQDFDQVFHNPTKATELFGPMASLVLNHRTEIKRLAKKAVGAIKEHETKGAAAEQQRVTQEQALSAARDKMWARANDDLAKRYPQYFGQKDNDPEWNNWLKKGFEVADLAFTDRNGMSPDKSVILDAQIRNRSAAFLPLTYYVKKLESENETLKKDLKEMRDSKPGAIAPNGEPQPKPRKGIMEDFDEKVKA